MLLEEAGEAPEPYTDEQVLHRLSEPTLGPTSLAFLTDVRDYPESGVAARYKRLGLSARQGQKLKNKLVQQELIDERDEHTQTGRLKVVRLTEQGRGALSESRLKHVRLTYSL